MNVASPERTSISEAASSAAASSSGAPEVARPLRRVTDWRATFGLREMGVFYALILLVTILAVATTYMGRSNYLSVLNLTNVIYQSSLTSIMAVAMTVILISGNFDLSVASVAALAAAVMVGLSDLIGFWPASAVAMLVACAAGALNGAIVQLLGINAFIVTLGTMTAIRGLVLIYTDGRSLAATSPGAIDAMRAFESGRVQMGWVLLVLALALIGAAIYLAIRAWRVHRSVPVASIGMIVGGACLLALDASVGWDFPMPKPIIYMAIFSGIVWFVLNFTTVGRRIYAVGGNSEAARLSGINVIRYKAAAFVLCSGAAGFAGILFGARLRSVNPMALNGAELTVIASAILGGTSLYGGAGSVVKTLAGALLLYTLTNGFNILNLGANYQGLIEGTVVVIAAAIYTVGGSRRRGKKI